MKHFKLSSKNVCNDPPPTNIFYICTLHTNFCRENFCQMHFVVDNVACWRRRERWACSSGSTKSAHRFCCYTYIKYVYNVYILCVSAIENIAIRFLPRFHWLLQRNNFDSQAGTNAKRTHTRAPLTSTASSSIEMYNFNLVTKHSLTLTRWYIPFYCFWSWLNFLLNSSRLSNKHRAGFRNTNDNHNFVVFVFCCCYCMHNNRWKLKYIHATCLDSATASQASRAYS